ncbi:MAG: PAS domain S-box protein, partial [Firmicutes bacterium]|nr:PAS domain S-box protein [Bacillota bacterium]
MVKGKLTEKRQQNESGLEACWNSGDLLKQVFSHSNVGLAILSENGTCLRTNEALQIILGYPAGSLEGMSFNLLLHPADGEIFPIRTSRIKINETGFRNKPVRCHHAEGKYRWFKASLCAIRLSDDTLCYSLMLEDIHDLVQAAHTLLSEDKKDHSIVESSPDCINHSHIDHRLDYLNHNLDILKGDLDKLKGCQQQLAMVNEALDHIDTALFVNDSEKRLVYVNKAACQLLSYSREELLQKDLLALDHMEIKELEDLLSFGSISDNTVKVKFQTAYKDRTGHIFPVDVSFFKYQWQGEQYEISLVKDISNQVQLDELLMRTEQDFEVLVEYSPDIIMRYDCSLKCIYVNQAWRVITGYPQYEMLDNTPSQVTHLPLEITQKMEHSMQCVVESGKRIKDEYAIKHGKTGKMVYVLVDIVPERDTNDKLSGILVTARDISKLKEKELELLKAKEKAEESSRLKSSFLAIISHEVRTPINAILGFLSLFKEGSKPLINNNQLEIMNFIMEAADKLVDMLENIIDLSKIISGDVKVDPATFEPEA